MELEDIGTDAIIDCLFTVIDRLINLATDRCHGKGIVVSANVITKRLADVILSSEQLEKLRRHRVERWQNYFSTEATHAKPGISVGGCCQMLSHPMKGMAVRTLNIHPSQIMDWPKRTKRLVCRRQRQMRWRWRWKVCLFQYNQQRSRWILN